MPYASDAQRKFFHTDTARKAGITPAMTKEYDEASRGKKLPEHKKSASLIYALQDHLGTAEWFVKSAKDTAMSRVGDQALRGAAGGGAIGLLGGPAGAIAGGLGGGATGAIGQGTRELFMKHPEPDPRHPIKHTAKTMGVTGAVLGGGTGALLGGGLGAIMAMGGQTVTVPGGGQQIVIPGVSGISPAVAIPLGMIAGGIAGAGTGGIIDAGRGALGSLIVEKVRGRKKHAALNAILKSAVEGGITGTPNNLMPSPGMGAAGAPVFDQRSGSMTTSPAVPPPVPQSLGVGGNESHPPKK